MRLCGDNIKKKLGFDVTLTKAGCESHILGYGVWVMAVVLFNVFRTGPIIELEKLLVHGSLVRLTVEPMTS